MTSYFDDIKKNLFFLTLTGLGALVGYEYNSPHKYNSPAIQIGDTFVGGLIGGTIALALVLKIFPYLKRR